MNAVGLVCEANDLSNGALSSTAAMVQDLLGDERVSSGNILAHDVKLAGNI